MSREIDLTKKLSDADRDYMLARGREQQVFQNDAEFTDDAEARRIALYIPGTSIDHAEGVLPTEGGDPLVNNGGGVAEGMPKFAERGDQALDGESFDSGLGALAHETDEEPATVDKYSGSEWTKDALLAEITRRNEGYSEDYQLATSGGKKELIARLVEDDNTPDEDDNDSE